MNPASPGPAESPRLSLRPVEPEHRDALFAIHADDEIARYLPYGAWRTPADADAWFERIRKRQEQDGLVQFVIIERQSQKVIGCCLLFGVDKVHGRAEIGYVLGRPHWGAGFMREALSSLLNFAFADLGLRRIEAQTDPLNAASNRVLLRLGFKQEGLLRERAVIQGQVKDSLMFGLLRHEWTGSQL
jgi:RimJ/RimL family protein N-acetyltransferase